MKKLLLIGFALFALNVGGSAFGADMGGIMVPPPPPPPPPPVFSWTGIYIGVEGGGGWGVHENSVTSFQSCSPGSPCITIPGTGVQTDSLSTSGVFYGGTVGLNAQTGPIVFGNPVVVGIEGDWSWANINGKGTCDNSFAPFAAPPAVGPIFNTVCSAKLDSFATLAGRAGVAVDHALIYVKGGGAWGRFDKDVNFSSNPLAVMGAPPGILASSSITENRWGFVIGAGIEYAFWGNWSAKIEYDFMDFGTKDVLYPLTGTLVGTTTTTFSSSDREVVHVFKAGLNFRFNWGVAGY